MPYANQSGNHYDNNHHDSNGHTSNHIHQHNTTSYTDNVPHSDTNPNPNIQLILTMRLSMDYTANIIIYRVRSRHMQLSILPRRADRADMGSFTVDQHHPDDRKMQCSVR